MARTPGYYWVTWTELADAEVAKRRPGPSIAQWDGAVWWFIRSDVYRFDRELKVLGNALTPPAAEFEYATRPALHLAEAS